MNPYMQNMLQAQQQLRQQQMEDPFMLMQQQARAPYNPAIMAAQRQQGENAQQEEPPPRQREAPKSNPQMGNVARAVLDGGQSQRDEFENDPIFKGTQKAMEATRRLLQLTERQQKTAEYKAINTFLGNIGKGKSRSMLGQLAEAATPGFEAYYNNLDTEENRNINYLNRADKMMAGPGPAKPGNVIALQKAYADAVTAKNAARDKIMGDWMNRIDPSQREKMYPTILKEVEGKLGDYQNVIDGIQRQANNLRIPLETYGAPVNPAMAQAQSNVHPSLAGLTPQQLIELKQSMMSQQRSQ